MVRTFPRRELLRRAPVLTAAGLAAWSLRFECARAEERRVSPMDRVGVGLIGCGDLGRNHHLKTLLYREAFEVRAVCDVDRRHLEQAVALTGNRATPYTDYRALLDRPDVDAVMIVTPDHWHALPAIDACAAGKDVYCEKPLSLTVQQGRAMVDAARRYGRVFQTGSQQRSSHDFHWACDLVRNGRIGTLRNVRACLGRAPTSEWVSDETPPPHLDWDRWLGPAPWVPYNPQRCHYQFRWYYDYSGGKLTDWGAHHLDIAQWAIGADGSGPVEVEGSGVTPPGMFETAESFDVHYRYANGVTVHCTSEGENGVTLEGSEGTIFVSRSRIAADPLEILDQEPDCGPVTLARSRDHWDDWLRAIRTRGRPICDVDIGHRSATVCHLGNIAIQLGRKLQWDPAAERFVADDAADRLLSRPMRSPWSL